MPKGRFASFAFVALVLFAPDVGQAQSGFIFTGDKATNSRNQREFIRISENLPVDQLPNFADLDYSARYFEWSVRSYSRRDCPTEVPMVTRRGWRGGCR